MGPDYLYVVVCVGLTLTTTKLSVLFHLLLVELDKNSAYFITENITKKVQEQEQEIIKNEIDVGMAC